MQNQNYSKETITLLKAQPAETPDQALARWAASKNVSTRNASVIRVIADEITFQVEIGPLLAVAAPAPRPVLPDYTRDSLMTPFGVATLRDRYMLDGETSPQDVFYRAARAFADNEAHAERLYSYMSRHWFMGSTPVLSNAPKRLSWGTSFEDNFKAKHFDEKVRGMPISCFLNYVPDSREGITEHYTENAMLSSMGGGIGGYWGAIRTNGINTSAGSRSSGAIPFMGVMDRVVLGFAQGATRRASYVMYLDISHPEILEFLEIRKPTGGDANRKSLNLHNAVNIPDSFMAIIERCMKDADSDDSWPLVDPHTKQVVEYVSARDLWQRLLEMRMQTGEPYLFFVDTANAAMPQAQKDAGLRIHGSNLCAEITLPTSAERTAVCCLSSVNLEYYSEWSKDPLFVEDLIRLLDNVLQFFIENAGSVKPRRRAELEAEIRQYFGEGVSDEEVTKMANYIVDKHLNAVRRAVHSARQERAVGLGAMGFHSYLQRMNLPFESAMATSANRRMFAHLKTNAERATVKLAVERGPAPDARGDMRRNMWLLAIAPNASSGIICGGTSPSIEPHRANAFTQKTDSGSWLVKNKYLEEVLDSFGLNTDEVWRSITTNRGSVQHLDALPQEVRDVYKTSLELDQLWLVEHAAHRQEFICQAQSLNIFLAPDVHVLLLHAVHYQAWKKGVKSLYYLRSESIQRADNVSGNGAQALAPVEAASSRDLLSTEATCLSCEG